MWNLRLTVIVVLLQSGLMGADWREPDLAHWIEDNGGDWKTDDSHRITDVYLGFSWVTDTDIKKLRPLDRLTRLDLSHTYISDAGVALLRSFHSLADLNLFAAESINDSAIRYLVGWKNLRRLNLRSTDISDTSIRYLATLSNLNSLDVSCTWVTDNGLEPLADLNELEELSLGGNKITGSGLHTLKLMPKLRSLSLKGSQRRNTGYWAVSITDFDMNLIGSLTGLERLDLGQSDLVDSRIAGVKISDLGVSKLKALRKLRLLDLSGTRITGAGLGELSDLSELEQLSLWRAKLIDDSAGPRLASMKALVALDLSETAISDKGLEQLGKLSRLKRLYISGTKVTAAGVASFGKDHPSVEVHWQ